ncbi:TetR/AcrR family transcriptional regulator [Agromyces salentinus]|uniref:TetR/AcrR family transcriptional regulator n=1 Tax=Agromyces salentinus TaxID=269421 RepID=UPI001478B1F0|nr:TetR family transcriptional regulator [Agromyces salentinus]
MRIADVPPPTLPAGSRAATAGADDRPSDLTTRARLRDAAIECFAAEGFPASVRTIAARAGVSAGLIRHHFGSKEALRAECDVEVLARHRSLKAEGLAGPAAAMAQLAEADEHGALLVYILRSVQDGSPAGTAFVERMIADALAYSEAAVADGVLRPSLDPPGRARLLVTNAIGGLIVQLAMHPEIPLADFKTVLKTTLDEIALPSIELYTYGVFADSSYLDQYLLYIGDPPR